jgi:cell division protein FtsB
MATLSRDQMEAVIANGGSILYGGRLITRVEHLPSEADLAAGDPTAEAKAAEKLERQMAQLQEQMKKLQEQQATPAKAPAKGKASEA